MKLGISHRAASMQSSPIRKLIPFADQAKAEGKKVYHLNIGQPDIETPETMLNSYRNFEEKVLAYGPSQGLTFYRQNLIRYYARHGVDLALDNILVTTAGSEAIILTFLAAMNPGDEVLIPEPFYTNYNGFASMAEVKIVPLTTKAENGFALPSVAEIEAKIGEKTRAIMICNPGNPTGAVYSRDDLKILANLAQQHDLYIIADEVYREFIYEGESHTSIMTFPNLEKNAIMIDSISKRYSACGARIGTLATKNQELMTALVKMAMARLCPPTIDQIAANAAIDIEEQYFHEVLVEYKKRRDIVFDALQGNPDIICKKPRGAFYIIANLPIEDAEDFVKWLLTDFSIDTETVMVAPAEGFYATPGLGKNEVRIAYVLNEEALAKAMNIFIQGLAAYQNR